MSRMTFSLNDADVASSPNRAKFCALQRMTDVHQETNGTAANSPGLMPKIKERIDEYSLIEEGYVAKSHIPSRLTRTK